eukprot:5623-Pelagomonas_calceolata.AAC.7
MLNKQRRQKHATKTSLLPHEKLLLASSKVQQIHLQCIPERAAQAAIMLALAVHPRTSLALDLWNQLTPEPAKEQKRWVCVSRMQTASKCFDLV